MRQGLREWAVVTAVLVLCAVAGSLRFGGEIRAVFGVVPPAGRATPAGWRPSVPSPAPR